MFEVWETEWRFVVSMFYCVAKKTSCKGRYYLYAIVYVRIYYQTILDYIRVDKSILDYSIIYDCSFETI